MKPLPTVGMLSCGDLGAALARALTGAGTRVLTTCQQRSPQTRARAEAAGVEILPELDDVVGQADVVFSVVLPAAAVHVARDYAARRDLRPANSVFVDLNSIAAPVVHEIAGIMDDANVPFVDGSIHGGAQRLGELAVMYVSGPDTDVVERVCGRVLDVQPLGPQIGSASRMKLLIAGLSKNLNVMFLEIGMLAENAGMLNEFLDGCRHFYPGIMTAIDRMLPTYPQHAARRVDELHSIAGLAEACGSPHDITRAAAKLLSELVESTSGHTLDHPSPAAAAVADVIRSYAASRFTHSASDPTESNQLWEVSS